MKKLKSMTEEGVDGKNKRRNTVSKKATEKKFTEHNCSKGEGTKDEPGSKGDLVKSMRSNAVENEKLKSDLVRRDRVVTRRNSAGGVVLDKKARAEKSSSAIGVKVGRGKNAAKKKVMTEDENSETVRSPVKRRNIDKKIAETVVSVVSSNEKSSYSL
ncbi:hypothetical protein L1049_008575 [Liquidambar formosana]|uniref:Uncharacterized protein n=1 Tax=Liquidambar formosana TaxID=63359 RepID=A0AAP0S385_LIQFO